MNNKKASSSIAKDDDAYCVYRGATLILSTHKGELKLTMPANGGNRWRLSRWLAVGFHFYRLPRCTHPQLTVARKKATCPVQSLSFITNRLPVPLLFVNSKEKAHNCQTSALLNATTVELVLLSPNTPILPELSVVLFTLSIYCPLM